VQVLLRRALVAERNKTEQKRLFEIEEIAKRHLEIDIQGLKTKEVFAA
jgi:hypothetical protein